MNSSPEALGHAFACGIAITKARAGCLLNRSRRCSRPRIPLRGAMLMLLRLHSCRPLLSRWPFVVS